MRVLPGAPWAGALAGTLAGVLLTAGCASGGFNALPQATSATSPAPSAGLAGHYYWGTPDGKYLLGVYFADGTHAYSGLPRQGLPRCTGGDTGSGTPQGIKAQGCTTYTYDASSGAVTVGSMRGTYSGGVFKLDGLHLAELDVPKPGSTLSVMLRNVYASGAGSDFTGGFSTLTLIPDGKFTTADANTVETLNGSVTSLPANQQGTYRIEDRGRLELDFADGTKVVRTIGLDQDNTRTPALRGAMLDSTYYENPAAMKN